MIYKYTAQNILSLLKMIPMATKEQLCMFFDNELEEMKVWDIIQQLEREHRIIKQVQSDKYEVYTVARPIRFSKRAVEEFIDAFWVIANFGSENVRFICTSNDVTKYLIILNDSTTYDITVCQTAEDARVGMLLRDLTGEDDDINHIALVYSAIAGEDMKEKLKRYGYDMYCVVDEVTHEARYFPIEE